MLLLARCLAPRPWAGGPGTLPSPPRRPCTEHVPLTLFGLKARYSEHAAHEALCWLVLVTTAILQKVNGAEVTSFALGVTAACRRALPCACSRSPRATRPVPQPSAEATTRGRDPGSSLKFLSGTCRPIWKTRTGRDSVPSVALGIWQCARQGSLAEVALKPDVRGEGVPQTPGPGRRARPRMSRAALS